MIRNLSPLCIICCFIFNATAQNIAKTDSTLKFDQRFTKCERKWVVLPKKDTDKSYLFGFIYIDSQAGFTFDLAGNFSVGENNHYVPDTSMVANTRIISRIDRNWRKVALLPPAHFEELHIKLQLDRIKSYYNYTDTVQHNFRWGFIYNDLDQCDTALVYLNKAYVAKPHYPGLEFELIFAYNALARYNDALNVINTALQNDPKNVLYYRELGYAYLQKKDYDKSITAYKQGIDMCTDKQNDAKSEMAINMANAYKSAGNLDEYKNWGNKAKGWATPGSSLYKFIVGQGF